MINELTLRVYQYRARNGKYPDSLAITKEQYDLAVEEFRQGFREFAKKLPYDEPQYDRFMGIPLKIVDVI